LQGGMVESFEYDQLDRVICARFSGMFGCQASWAYAPGGNIEKASSVGAYTYDPDHPHAVQKAGQNVYVHDAVGNQIGRPNATVSYTAFDQPREFTLSL
jgi:hypothetical protein